MSRLTPGMSLLQFSLMITEDLRVATATAHSRANDIQAECLALRSWEHPNFGKEGHQRAVDTGIRELNEEARLLQRDINKLRTLIDLLMPYVSEIADAGH